jgi:putative ABC transport system substrate-binding protein
MVKNNILLMGRKNFAINYKTMVVTSILILACVFLSGCVGQTQEKKIYHVGMLNGLGEFLDEIPGAFKAKMTELGYIEGENIIYDIQSTMFEPEKEKQILNKFVEDKVDLIFTFPTEVSMAGKAATEGTGVPMIFAIANIEGTGLVNSVREPGGNITGVRYPGPDLAVKRFEVMHEIVPNAKTMLIPYQRGYPIVANQMEALYPVAEAVGVTLIELPADNATELQAELDAINASGDIPDVILFIPEPLSTFSEPYAVIGKFAYEHDIPIGGLMMQVGEYGSIFGINVDIPKTGQQAAVLADKILKGTPAGTIPVVSSESYFEINYGVAERFGITVPEGLLTRADKIIR